MASSILNHPPTKAALYARVSTANNGQDPEVQTRELREYCQRRRWTIAGEYIDVGISGAVVVMDYLQLKTDVDSYNQNYNNTGRRVQMILDFSRDVEEMEAISGEAHAA